MSELRLYTFVIGTYLSDKQKGIQSGHLADQMTADYILSPVLVSETTAKEIFIDWIKCHKTYIVLNAGNLKGVKEAYGAIATLATDLKLPFGKFHESEDDLGGLMTCCGVVVPEEYYGCTPRKNEDGTRDWVSIFHEDFVYKYGSKEWELIDKIKSFPLA